MSVVTRGAGFDHYNIVEEGNGCGEEDILIDES